MLGKLPNAGAHERVVPVCVGLTALAEALHYVSVPVQKEQPKAQSNVVEQFFGLQADGGRRTRVYGIPPNMM
jgi:hypothetical protein